MVNSLNKKFNETINILLGGSKNTIEKQNNQLLQNIRLLDFCNSNKIKGGSMSIDEKNEFNKLKDEITKLKEQNNDLETRLVNALEENESSRKSRKKTFEEYDLMNLKKFEKTEDNILQNPEIFKYDENMTAFDKNSKKNIFRPYQKKFIEDWSVSAQECCILYYGVGSGKTMIAVNCAEQFSFLNTNSHIYFLTPASLVLNTIKEMYDRGIDPNRKNDNGEHIYYFVSYQQLLNSDLIFKPNSLLIIDEVHNLRNFGTESITEKQSARRWKKTDNFSLVGTRLGITLLKNENKFLRTIFMTGTLFVNSKYDLEPIISLGYKKTPLYRADIGELNIIEYSKDLFKNYYQGLISFYRIPNDQKEFPSKKYHFVLIDDKTYKKKGESYDLTPYRAKQIISTYNNINKQKSKGIKAGKVYNSYDENYINQLKEAIKTNNFKGLKNELPEKDRFFMTSRNEYIINKGKWILKFLLEHKDEKTLIYSQFRGYSLEPLLKILDKHNLKYGFINGSLAQDQKLKVVQQYNTDQIKILFFTLSIKEGISFKETDNIIVNEPYWNYAIMEQILARGIRLNSHKNGYKSLINLYMLVGIDNSSIMDSKQIKIIKNWKSEADNIMNNDIKTLNYNLIKAKDKNGNEIDVKDTMIQRYSSLGNFRDIYLYNLMFDKQEDINVFEKKLLSLPRFEDVNNNENNDFIKEYNETILNLEKERDLTNKDKIIIKKQMYKEFYDKSLSEINKKLTRFNSDVRHKENRNPNIEEIISNTEYKDIKTKIRNIIKEGGHIDEIFKAFKLDKQTITTFQANFTPKSEVNFLIEQSDIKNDKKPIIKILEPTCGIGNVIRGLLELQNKQNFLIDANEIHSVFFQTASVIYEGIDNVKFTNLDFMTYASKDAYDYIIGNPPFNIRTILPYYDKKSQTIKNRDVVLYDVDFVARSYNLLAEGGKLCMIISDRFLRDTKTKPFVVFNAYLNKYLKGNFTIANVGEFKKDETITKEMTTKYPMVCITIKRKHNVIIDLDNINFLELDETKLDNIKKEKKQKK